MRFYHRVLVKRLLGKKSLNHRQPRVSFVPLNHHPP